MINGGDLAVLFCLELSSRIGSFQRRGLVNAARAGQYFEGGPHQEIDR